ncbi:MAG: SDR family oxidoreductase [Bacteroidetes bacterium]|nr:SDR family oxidoreductase [Bacteroidota bacterium]
MPTILITGISRGIGRAIATRFHQEGYHLIGCSRSEDSIRAFREDFPMAAIHRVDLADKAQLKAFAAQYAAIPIDVLVNNAGLFIPGGVTEEDDSVYETLMRTNMDSAYYLTKAIVPGMKARQQGTILNICSTASKLAYANGGSYAISKHAMLGFNRVLREELKPHGVRVVALLPGPTYTDSWIPAGLPAERFVPAAAIADLAWTAVNLPAGTVIEELVVRPQLGDI